MKPTKCPAKEKKWVKKNEKRGSRESEKQKDKTAGSLLNPKSGNLALNILHLDQKAAKCMTCKQLCGKF